MPAAGTSLLAPAMLIVQSFRNHQLAPAMLSAPPPPLPRVGEQARTQGGHEAPGVDPAAGPASRAQDWWTPLAVQNGGTAVAFLGRCYGRLHRCQLQCGA